MQHPPLGLQLIEIAVGYTYFSPTSRNWREGQRTAGRTAGHDIQTAPDDDVFAVLIYIRKEVRVTVPAQEAAGGSSLVVRIGKG